MNRFKLKIFACISMFLDHFARLFHPAIYPLIYIGRFAFPIFAFQAAEGFEYTKNLKKYIIRLLIFAIISQIPFYLYISKTSLNVIFTILFGVIGLFFYKYLVSQKRYPLAFMSIALVGFLAEFLKTDYGCYGVFIIFLFYVAKNNKVLTTVGFTILTSILYIPRILSYGFNNVIIFQYVFTLLSLIPILLYNNKQGKKVKYLIYIFYPIHLIILYILRLLFFN